MTALHDLWHWLAYQTDKNARVALCADRPLATAALWPTRETGFPLHQNSHLQIESDAMPQPTDSEKNSNLKRFHIGEDITPANYSFLMDLSIAKWRGPGQLTVKSTSSSKETRRTTCTKLSLCYRSPVLVRLSPIVQHMIPSLWYHPIVFFLR